MPRKSSPLQKITMPLPQPNRVKTFAVAFDQGQSPNIVCIDATVNNRIDGFDGLVRSLGRYVTEHLGPIWGVKAQVITGTVAAALKPTDWCMMFQDEPDVQNAYGYHYLTPGNQPLSKIFVSLAETSPGGLGVTASHELAEMLIDPGIQLCAVHPDGTIYAYEVADACEEQYFAIEGWNMSDFVYPAWFEGFRKRSSTVFDHLSLIQAPYQILKGGYMSIYQNGEWSQIFGNKKAEKEFDIKKHSRACNRHKKVVKVK